MIESIRLTNTEKELLVRIKRKTGIESWNIICRWALIQGLKENNLIIRDNKEKRDAVEIKWETFAGQMSDLLKSIIKQTHNKYQTKVKNVNISDFIYSRLEDGIRSINKTIVRKSQKDWFIKLDDQ